MRNPLVLPVVLILLAAVGYFLLAPARDMLPEKISAEAPAAKPNIVLGGQSSETAEEEDRVSAGEPEATVPTEMLSSTPSAGEPASEADSGFAGDAVSGGLGAEGPKETVENESDGASPPPSQDDASLQSAGAASESQPNEDGQINAPASEQTAAQENDADNGREELLEKLSPAAKAASQGPGLRAPGGDLVLQAFGYDSLGNLTILGTAQPGTTVELKFNGEQLGQAVTQADGKWQFVPTSEQVPPGSYRLEVEALDADGVVVSKLTTPFRRVSQEKAIQASQGGDVFVVQPGDNLWKIATRSYGSGYKYTDIQAANKDSVPNANLINPGLVLVLPPVE